MRDRSFRLGVERLEDRTNPTSWTDSPFPDLEIVDSSTARINTVTNLGSDSAARLQSPFVDQVEHVGFGIYNATLGFRSTVEEAIAYYTTLPSVTAVEPDFEIQIQRTPNDPQFPVQYGLGKIAAPPVIASGFAPFTGSFRSESSLSVFNGLNSRGTWKLSVRDVVNGDIGNLTEFAMIVTGISGTQYVRALGFHDENFIPNARFSTETPAAVLIETFNSEKLPVIKLLDQLTLDHSHRTNLAFDTNTMCPSEVTEGMTDVRTVVIHRVVQIELDLFEEFELC